MIGACLKKFKRGIMRVLVRAIRVLLKERRISLNSQEILDLMPKDVLSQIKDLKNEDFINQNQIFFSKSSLMSPPPIH